MSTPLVVQRRIPADHPAFAGHFPGRPLLPGVLLLSEVLEALHAHGQVAGRGVDIGAAKFLSPVAPGDVLTVSLAEQADAGGWRFEVSVDGRRVCTGSLVGRAGA